MKRLLMTMVILTLGASTAFAQDVKREITRVSGDVYRFQNKFHVNMFVVTGLSNDCCSKSNKSSEMSSFSMRSRE